MTGQIDHLLKILSELQKIDPEFPLQYARCLCEIAIEEGMSLSRLAEKTDMPLSTISRIVGALSTKRQKGLPYELIRVDISTTERRRKELFLTPKGHNFMTDLCKVTFNIRDI